LISLGLPIAFQADDELSDSLTYSRDLKWLEVTRRLRRLYIARDADAAGDMALAALTERAEAAGVEALALSPRMSDFNEDLRAFGLGALRAALRIQLASQDVVRFMLFAEAGAV